MIVSRSHDPEDAKRADNDDEIDYEDDEIDYEDLTHRLAPYRQGTLKGTTRTEFSTWRDFVFTARQLRRRIFPQRLPGLLVAFENTVYDVTELCETHPGGRNAVQSNAGKDITAVFKTTHLD
jgi:hypothetical protein